MRNLFKYAFIICIFVLSACSKDTKLQSKGVYIDVSEATFVMLDSSLQYHPIGIPNAESNTEWPSSSFSLSNISENIFSDSKLSNISTYTLYRGSVNQDLSRTPVIYNNSLFVLNNNDIVYAYNANNPSILLWEKDLNNSKGEFFGGGIAINSKYLAATYGNKDLVLLNHKTGNEVWRYNLSNISRSTPLIYQNSVLILTVDNKLYSIDLETGLLKWTNENANEEFGMIGNASPEIYKDKIIVPYSSGQINTISFDNGETLWSLLLGSGTKQAYLNDIDMTPVVKNASIFASNYGGSLFALNLDTAAIEWTNPNASGNNSIWVADDYIYSINKDKKLLAIYKETGAIKWITNLSSLSQKYLDGVKYSGPIMVNSKLYICSSNGELLVFTPKTGKKIKTFNVTTDIYSPPIAANNKIYLFSNSGALSILK